MIDSLAESLDNDFIAWLCSLAPSDSIWGLDIIMRGLIALILVSLISGAVGSLVVSNRMTFFSDALAHCAFAGVAAGLLIALLFNVMNEEFRHWITLIRIAFGIGIGLLIAYVQEKSALPSDTVIGVFFAGALGLGAIFARAVQQRAFFNLESFIFGSPTAVSAKDLLWLILLLVLTVAFLAVFYNPLMFGSFNTSLARSRRMRARLARYMFVVLLAVIVNLCQQTVGILLINGLLIVPAAAASNMSGNLRQLLWGSVVMALFCGVFGMVLAQEINMLFARTERIEVGIGGTVVVLSVVMFALSMALGRMVKRWRGASGF